MDEDGQDHPLRPVNSSPSHLRPRPRPRLLKKNSRVDEAAEASTDHVPCASGLRSGSPQQAHPHNNQVSNIIIFAP